MRQRSLLFLIGDFFGTQDLDLRAISMKHEVVVIIVRDRFEEEPALLGEINITDPSTGLSSSLELDKKAAEAIREKVLEEERQLYKQLKRSGIKFIKIYTDENPAEKILTLMNRR